MSVSLGQQMVVEAMARGTAWIGLGAPVKGLIAPYLQAGIKADIRSFGNSPDVNIAMGVRVKLAIV